jgi:hypothetical protein
VEKITDKAILYERLQFYDHREEVAELLGDEEDLQGQ